jgi:hypothetical protein
LSHDGWFSILRDLWSRNGSVVDSTYIEVRPSISNRSQAEDGKSGGADVVVRTGFGGSVGVPTSTSWVSSANI